MFADARSPWPATPGIAWPVWLYAAIVVSTLTLGVWQYAANGWTETATLLFCRYTARLSFLLFVVVFVVRPLRTLVPTALTTAMLRRRRHLGLAFALAHGIHLAGIGAHLSVTGNGLEAGDAVPGFTYLMIALMAATSNRWSVRMLGRGWKVLHKTGIYVIAFTFAAAYAGRVFGGYGESAPPPGMAMDAWAAYATLLGLLAAGLVLRVAAFVKTLRR